MARQSGAGGECRCRRGWGFCIVGKFGVGFIILEAFWHDLEVVFVHIDAPDADGMVCGASSKKLDVR